MRALWQNFNGIAVFMPSMSETREYDMSSVDSDTKAAYQAMDTRELHSLAHLAALAEEKRTLLHDRLLAQLPDTNLSLDYDLRTSQQRYTWVPDEVAHSNAALRKAGSPHLHDYNRYVLLYFLSKFSIDAGRYQLPDSVRRLYPRDIRRILDQIEALEDSFFDIENDHFLKDLAILSHRLIPVGAEYAQGGAGVPRSLAFRGGAKQFFNVLWFSIVRTQGFKPFFAIHTHTLVLEDFNEEGWLETYHRLAELLALNPGMKGWLSASWFLDPALETISPHLAHLRKVPVENGAALFFVREENRRSSGALAKSKTRRHLFAEGKYVPAAYMRVWPRKSAISWSERHRLATVATVAPNEMA